jgi:hypothetical protein
MPGDQHDRGPLGRVPDLRREPPHPVLVQAATGFVEVQQVIHLDSGLVAG